MTMCNFSDGVVYGFELAIEILAKFNFWNDARTNPPKFDDRRKYPTLATFICVARYDNNCIVSEFIYDFTENKWLGVDEKNRNFILARIFCNSKRVVEVGAVK